MYKLLLGITDGTVDLGIGPRFFHYGYFLGKPGQRLARCLEIAERRMIREAVEKRLTIVNERGIRIKTHSVIFEGPSQNWSVFEKVAEVED